MVLIAEIIWEERHLALVEQAGVLVGLVSGKVITLQDRGTEEKQI